MSLFDLFNLDPQKVVDFLAKLNIIVSVEVVDRFISILVLFVFVVAIVWGAYKKWNAIALLLSSKRRWRQKYIKRGLEHSFGDYISPEKQKCYVSTHCQGTPPHNFDEPDESVASTPKQDLTSFFIDEVFTTTNTNRQLYCIFAGSGMGKTTFAVHLFIEYINKYKKTTLPYEIYILDMGEAKVIDEIKELKDKLKGNANHSILLLDALDENLHASENFVEFRKQLEEVISPFKFVVITCRSQFFPNEQEIPTSSSIRSNTSEKNLLSYNRVYICPFSYSDISKYIAKKYRGLRKKDRRLRKKAKTIINSCSHLMARPVLLSYIDDLIDVNEELKSVTEIYELLIQKWLKREVNIIPDLTVRQTRFDELLLFSKKLAVRMYQNWRETGDFKMDALQMDEFCSKNGFNKCNYQFPRRSLINHDAAGSYKFSHKSFLEFFLAQSFFEDSSFDFSFEGMDMAELFYRGFCKREYRDRPNQQSFVIKTIGGDRDLPVDEFTLVVTKKTDYDFSHLYYVIPNHFSELELNWSAYNYNVQRFIEDSGIHTIVINNYIKGDVGLRQILNSPYLEFISIEGENVPKSFVKDAEKKGIHVLLNGQTIVKGAQPSFNSSLRIRMMLQMEERLRLIQRERLLIGHNLIDELLNQDINEKGGTL